MPTCFTLEPRPPFRLDLTVWVLRRRPANLVDRWDGTSYRRVMSLAGVGAVVEIAVRQTGSPEAPTLDVSVVTAAPVDPGGLQAAVAAALGRLLGLDVNLDDFYRRVVGDPHLGPLADRFRGLKPPRFPTMFESVANAIACQQLTLTVGIMLLNRLAESHGPSTPRTSDHGFPDPSDLALADPARLRELGFSSRKAAALVDIARRIAGGELDLEPLRDADDSAASAALQRLGGVGRWSAEYALLRGLGRLEVFPGDDVGARNNLAHRLGLASPLDYDDVRQAVAPWAPYAGVAYFHLLAERIDAAGWLDRGDAPGDGDVFGGSAEVRVRRRRRQQPAKPRIRGLYESPDWRFTMVMLIEGKYKCDWCGADLDLAFADHATFEIITQHGDVDVRIIVVDGEEHHRCERSATTEQAEPSRNQ